MELQAKLTTAVLVATLLAAPLVRAQNQPAADASAPAVATMTPPGPDGPRGPHADGPGRGRRQGERHQPRPGRPDEGRRGQGLTSLTTVSGTVGQWVGNDDAILDGFTFSGTANAPTTVKFPPHLGQQVQKAIKPGSSISVTGFTDTNPRGESTFRMVSLTAGKTVIADTPPAAPTTTPPTPTLTTVSGKISDYRLGRDGRVNGLVLDDKTIVRIPPHVAYQLTNLATKGSAVTVQGYAKNLRDGQVQLEKTNILNASVLTINGQQYLVR